MRKILLKNGNVVDESGAFEQVDLLISGEIIEQIDSAITVDAIEIDLAGKVVVPGLIDMQVHLREPGGEEKETIATGLRAALCGGFTTVAAMPNTDPVMDSIETVDFLRKKVASLAICDVVPIPAMTQQMMQKKLADFESYRDGGIVAITDDGRGVADDGLMTRIFEKAAECKLSILQHCEFFQISNGGVFHDGGRASELKVKGIPSASEYEMIARDIELLRQYGGHYHVLHLSTKEGVDLVARAKAEGLNITAEVTPHHLILCDRDIPGIDANYKMNPPLRSAEDRAALVQGVISGIIDIISTDHAPHTAIEKDKEIHKAPFGIIGLETAFPLLYTEMVLSGKIDLKRLIELMAIAPARIFQLPGGAIKVGAVANLVVIDTKTSRVVSPETFLSKGRNTPFGGRTLKGWPVRTFYRGSEVWKRE